MKAGVSRLEDVVGYGGLYGGLLRALEVEAFRGEEEFSY
jgi:hypothetical protein